MQRFGWLVFAVMVACSGGAERRGPVDLGDGLQPDNMAAAWKVAYCHYQAKCGLYGDEATCIASNLLTGLAIGHDEQVAAEEGKLAWNGAAAQACVDAIAGSSCDATSESARTSLVACYSYIHGFVHDGGACELWNECISGYCKSSSCGHACCPGTCVGDSEFSPIPVGASCYYSVSCVAGAWCDHGGIPENQDAYGFCAPLRAAGDRCNFSLSCPYGLACVSGRCGTAPAIGEACGDTCRDVGATCINGTCVAFGLDGDACSDTAPCAWLLACDATQHCTRGLSTGAPCEPSDLCADVGTACVRGVCRPLDPDGSPCVAGSTCESYVCEAGRCAQPAVCI